MSIPYCDFIKKCIDRAYQISGEYENGFLGAEHILWAMIYEEGLLFNTLSEMSVDIDDISRRLESSMEDYKGLAKGKGPQTKRLQKIFELANGYAEKLKLKEIEEENLITALLNSGLSTAVRIISVRIPDIKSFKRNINKKYGDVDIDFEQEVNSSSDLTSELKKVEPNNIEKAQTTRPLNYIPLYNPALQGVISPVMNTGNSLNTLGKINEVGNQIQFFTRDLSMLSLTGKLKKIQGRDKEIANINLCLMKTKTNHPVIVGERGTGRTALVEGVVSYIRSEASPMIKNSRVIEITRNKIFQIFGDSKDNGQKFKDFLKNAMFPGNIIVFDSVMEIAIEDRVTWGVMSVLNDIKQLIEEQKIRTIMITTPEAYEKVYVKDPILSVCCEKIDLKELDIDTTVEILKAENETLASHYNIDIPVPIINKSIRLADEFIKNSYFPSKAFLLLDEACAMSAMDNVKTLSIEYVEKAVAKQAGISIDNVRRKNVALKSMNDILKKKIIGQDNAIEKVCDRIRLFMAGLNNDRRPLGVFFFAGPTGVGKTELAKIIASEIFGSEDKLFRFDMSEYSQPHEVARLIGAPPGYVGYADEGQLTGAVKRNPNCVILLDEFEKAHEKIFNIFLQVFDAGRLTDGKGQSVDFRNTLIIMTSNIGANLATYSEEDNEDRRAHLINALKSRFSMEFINRIDDVVLFNKLKEEDIYKICRMITDNLCEKIKKNNIGMIIEDDVIKALCAQSYDERFGVRNMKRIIEDTLIIPVSKKIVEGDIPSGITLRASLNGTRIEFSEEEIKGGVEDSTAFAKNADGTAMR